MTRTVRNARLVVAYDGSTFHGFALNREVPTVAGALTEALEKSLSRKCDSSPLGEQMPGCTPVGKC